MADEEQVALLRRSVKAWNHWRLGKSPIDLSGADLYYADLRGANLSYANLAGADLSNAHLGSTIFLSANLENANLENANLHYSNLTHANLRNANLRNAKLISADLPDADLIDAKLGSADLSNTDLRSTDFSNADLSSAHLSNADLSNADLGHANLSSAHLSFADLSQCNLSDAELSFADLSNVSLPKANLCRADLRNADLTNADLTDANLRNADLTKANLTQANLHSADLRSAQVSGADLKCATLTGACIDDWHISSFTLFKGVICDYIFRSYDIKRERFSSRLPVNVNSIFIVEEFEKWVHIRRGALDTIDITFADGIDWSAFFQSFQELKQKYSRQNIAVQEMEDKEGTFIVRLKVETTETGAALEKLKGAIETEVKHRYANQLVVLDAQYKERLRLQGAHLEDAQRTIEVERQRNAGLIGVISIVAKNQGSKYEFHQPNIGNFVDTAQSGSQVQAIQHIYAPENDLGEVAEEIQALLNTLAKIYNTTTDDGKKKLMKELGQEVKQHPKWRRALKEGGIELIKVLFAPIGVPLEMARIYLEEE